MDRDHLVNLDELSWIEASAKIQEEARLIIHNNCIIRRICHIFKNQVYCFCKNGRS